MMDVNFGGEIDVEAHPTHNLSDKSSSFTWSSLSWLLLVPVGALADLPFVNVALNETSPVNNSSQLAGSQANVGAAFNIPIATSCCPSSLGCSAASSCSAIAASRAAVSAAT